ncbi:sensor histidine kinase [Massilia sp. TS11]|uniref:sensor histidine kinase n=1 Tax=Massilia sp. TS11 TaxID=2908003 RepID=UPI001EDB416D|nr:histidine kinase [Massilia sp. TS11]MCG2584127.1 histidine kinase [Massilia sp. TS11]
MFASLFFVFRILLAWAVVYILSSVLLVETAMQHDRPNGGYFVLAGFIIHLIILSGLISHVRRVRLIAGAVSLDALGSRHRRQIEIPFDANFAFGMVEAAIRDLPGAHDIEAAPDSLQVRAKLRRIEPYSAFMSLKWRVFEYFGSARNQVYATITPNGDAASVTVLCEPERSAWADLFLVDDGTNLENAEAIMRALTRRVAEARRGEKASVQQTMTEKELTVAKLNLLHAQVEPHFLYNTLANAQLLTRSDPARADQMLGNLIQYLRHSLPRTEDSLSTLGEELERARAYLDILKIRMGPRLHLQIDVAEPLKAVLFPSMMLQTLVENAIKHGLEPKPGGGNVWIIARTIDDKLAVTVADDGRGFSAETGGTGIGLRNVRERLRLAYGADASFAIVANFPSGVAATITVPNAPIAGGQHD